ncbi:DUF412 domain-containing protein [Aliidiomarina sedimenti]|uniref:UPF0208 membrane protein YfbV n=1 Tax=Aliidiomarina sedimenti TaxID=1933879 RepID=A0ABY0C256_9GAMM|nr:terminus macrodomain insulation protein YfbV [Aliidiomarina sedimenti]RUO31824.1 DUF412 domain-containing protein [Aliidiomarina sedimenti]
MKVFANGWRYMKLWPNHAVVGALPEAQIIPLTRLVSWMLPAAAVTNFGVQWFWLGTEHLPMIIMASMFLLLLPLQGYYWLGKRAYSELPLNLRGWYFELQSKLQVAGQDVRLPSHRPGPCYIDLALILRKALSELPPDQY